MFDSVSRGLIFGTIFSVTAITTTFLADRALNRKAHKHTAELRERFEKLKDEQV